MAWHDLGGEPFQAGHYRLRANVLSRVGLIIDKTYPPSFDAINNQIDEAQGAAATLRQQKDGRALIFCYNNASLLIFRKEL